MWVGKANAARVPLNNLLLHEQAVKLAQRLDLEQEPSLSWVNKFRERHGLQYRKVHGEAGSVTDGQVQEAVQAAK